MHILEISDSYPDNCWLEYEDSHTLGHMKFKSCTLLDLPDTEEIKFKASKKLLQEKLLSFDYLFSNGPDLISDRLANLLSSHIEKNEVQIFPAKILKDNETISGFNVINYLKCEPAIDLANSTYKPLLSSMPDGPRKFLHTVLLDRDPNSDIFRAAENIEEVMVSEKLRQLLEAHNIKGIKLIKEKKR